MKEDILEQLVDDYLQTKGYFTRHNVKYHPAKDAKYDSKKDSVASDIDVIGIHPHHRGSKRVWVVNCKSWQSGVNLAHWISGIEEGKILNGKDAWKTFRELANPKWADAFIAKIEELTGAISFTYVLAVTKLKGEQSELVEHKNFRKNLHGNPIKILTVDEILDYLHEHTTKSIASSEVGRLLQVIKASGWMNKKD